MSVPCLAKLSAIMKERYKYTVYLYLSFLIADLAKHGTDMAGKQTTFSIAGKPKDDDYYQSKSACLFKSCVGLRFSGLQDYDTFLEKFFSILSITG